MPLRGMELDDAQIWIGPDNLCSWFGKILDLIRMSRFSRLVRHDPWAKCSTRRCISAVLSGPTSDQGQADHAAVSAVAEAGENRARIGGVSGEAYARLRLSAQAQASHGYNRDQSSTAMPRLRSAMMASRRSMLSRCALNSGPLTPGVAQLRMAASRRCGRLDSLQHIDPAAQG